MSIKLADQLLLELQLLLRLCFVKEPSTGSAGQGSAPQPHSAVRTGTRELSAQSLHSTNL